VENNQQGRTYLYRSDENTFCCLGVAGDVCKIPLKDMNKVGTFWYYKQKNKIPLILFGNITKDNMVVCKLTNMNDDGKSFKRIATWIEKYL
jgi:hypothetical protein